MKEYVKIRRDTYDDIQEELRMLRKRNGQIEEILRLSKKHTTVLRRIYEEERMYLLGNCIKDESNFEYAVLTDDEAVKELTEQVGLLSREVQKLKGQR